MENFKKFEGIDYVNNFAVKINTMHQLVASHLPKIIKEHQNIIDIGGGPGIGAKLIDQSGNKVKVLNVEPSNNINEVPTLQNVDYSTLQLSFKEALLHMFPWKANVFLMISAAHEIALSNGLSSEENKQIFFKDFKSFIATSAHEDAVIAIGFPNYKAGVTEDEIANQRAIVESNMGHSHPPHEFFQVEEFSQAFASEPVMFYQTPMPIAGQSEKETSLVANFVVYKL